MPLNSNLSAAACTGNVWTTDELLGGSWYLLTNYNWAYNPTDKWDNPYIRPFRFYDK